MKRIIPIAIIILSLLGGYGSLISSWALNDILKLLEFSVTYGTTP